VAPIGLVVVALRQLLLLDPTVEIVALEAPLSANLERGNLAALRHRVDCLLGNLQQQSHFGQRQDLIRHQMGSEDMGRQLLPEFAIKCQQTLVGFSPSLR
jgi:hypothetical protein